MAGRRQEGAPEGRVDDNGREQGNDDLARSQKSTLNSSGKKKRQAPLSFPLKSTSFDEQKDATTGLSSRRTVFCELGRLQATTASDQVGSKMPQLRERGTRAAATTYTASASEGRSVEVVPPRRAHAGVLCEQPVSGERPLKRSRNPAERKGVTDAFPARSPALEGSYTAEECLPPPPGGLAANAGIINKRPLISASHPRQACLQQPLETIVRFLHCFSLA